MCEGKGLICVASEKVGYEAVMHVCQSFADVF